MSAEPQQLSLLNGELSADDELLLTQAKRRAGNFDGSRSKHAEEVITEMLRARAEGLSVRACARLFKMSEHTVLRLEEQRLEDVATAKKDLAKDFRTLSRLAVSRMIEEIDAMPRASLPVVAGVAADKMQVLEGEPSAIIARTDGIGREKEDLNAMIAALPAADAEVLDAATGKPITAEDARDKKGGNPDAGKEAK